jgi:hypothetical protein
MHGPRWGWVASTSQAAAPFYGRPFEISAGLCEELAQHALGRYAVSVIGEEPWLADR